MNGGHDAFRQLEYIQQTLSQNKKSVGFFIGAGCPLAVRVNHREIDGKNISDALIPDVAGLTMKIGQQLAAKDGEEKTNWDKIIQTIVADGFDQPTIEDILTQIRSLFSVAGKGDVRGFKADDLKDLDKKICKIIVSEVDKALPDIKSPYHNLAIWTRSINRDHPVHVFTTNYDLLVEQAFEDTSAPYFDGFIGARSAFFDLGAVENENLLPSRWTRLWKIHGSINWRLDANEKVIRSDKVDQGQSYLIYPSHLKYSQSRKMPYLAMLDRLKEFLLKPSAIVFFSGYSFSDEHINDILCSSLDSNSTAMAFVFLFGKLNEGKYEKAVKCALRTPNLSLLAFDKAIIGRSELDWTFAEDKNTNLPEGIIAPKTGVEGSESTDTELRLGDFFQFGILLRNLSRKNDGDDE